MLTNIYKCGDCRELLQGLPDRSIDLVVTSPPYAMKRKKLYQGVPEEEYPEWIGGIAKELHRVLKDTGSFVLNLKEHVSGGVRLPYVMKSVAEIAGIFRWTDTFVWVKTNPFPTGNQKRLKDGFEYCYWFTKTKDYKFFVDNVMVRSTSKWLASEKRRKNREAHVTKNGSGMTMRRRIAEDMVRPSNVITMATDTTNHVHPATFPIGLPMFFIKAMTEEGDVVLDPFAGSGTTLVAAKKLRRQWIGYDIEPGYQKIGMQRIQDDRDSQLEWDMATGNAY